MKFIDLFAGIGGLRLAFENAGATCVFSSEWDKFAQQTYAANFGEKPMGDIREIDSTAIPDHDILTAGFPCQPFSISGVSKKKSLGREHGFKDETQGTLFFEIVRILEAKQPSAFLLENVKNLKSHDKKRTFNVMMAALHELGYTVHHAVIDAQAYVPQHRERIFLVGIHNDHVASGGFSFPTAPDAPAPRIKDILLPNVEAKYTISDKLWHYLQGYAEKHRRKGNGFGFGLIDPATATYTRTLSARYYKDGSEILIKQEGKNPRRLTPRECARLMGFPSDFVIPVSDTQAYKQFGNSVVVPLAASIALQLIRTLTGTIHTPQAFQLTLPNKQFQPVPVSDQPHADWADLYHRE